MRTRSEDLFLLVVFLDQTFSQLHPANLAGIEPMECCLPVLMLFAVALHPTGETLSEESRGAIEAEHRSMMEQSRWFRLKTTHDFLRVSDSTRKANAAVNADVDLPTTDESEVAVLGRWTLQRGRNRHGGEFVSGQNDKYLFQIEKSVGAASFQIVRFEHSSAEDGIDNELSDLRCVIFPECHAFTETLVSLTTHPAFRITNLGETIGSDGQTFKRIEFEFLPSEKPDKQIRGAFVECDPNNGWRVVRGGGKFGRFQNYCEFTTVFPDQEGSRERTMLLPVTDDPDSCRRTVNSVTPLDQNPNRPEFFLAHYGLREPGVAATWSFRWVVLLVVGTAFIWFSIRWGKGKAIGR